MPYWLLIQNFEYDDILRKPTDYLLTQFHADGTGLILTWFVFALMALLFIPASALLQKVLGREDTPYLAAATIMGVLSGMLQSIGLMRWVFVIPVLANLYVDASCKCCPATSFLEQLFQPEEDLTGVTSKSQVATCKRS